MGPIVLAVIAATQFAVSSPSTAHFVHVPFLPKCMAVSVLQGNPRTSASVQLARIDSGCVIPWHSHDANTRLILVAGSGVHRIQGGAPMPIRAGDSIFLPAHQLHWFRCSSTCYAYNIQDGADTVHWIRGR